MRLWKTAAAVVVLAGLVSFLYFYEYKGEAAREEAKDEQSRALSFDMASIETISLQRPGERTIDLVRRDGAWHMTAPIATRADDRKIDGILSSLRSLKVERTLDGIETGERGTFGLAEPAARVTLHPAEGAEGAAAPADTAHAAVAAARPHGFILDLGGAVPVSGGRYAARPGETGVLLVAGDVGDLLEATADSLRQKKLVGLDAWTVRQVTVKSADRTMALEKKGDSWRMTAPDAVPADEARVDAIVTSLTSAEATGIADETPGPDRLAAYGLTPETGAIEVDVSGEGTPARAVVGKPGAEGSVWARRSDMDAVMIVAASLGESLRGALASPESLRDPRPARFNRFALSRLEVTEAGSQERTRILYKDSASSWHLGSEEGAAIPSERVNAILDALETLVADRWGAAAEQAGARETLSIVLAEHPPGKNEAPAEPLKLGLTLSEGSKEATIASSLAGLRYIVPANSAGKLIDAVMQLEEPLPETAGPESSGPAGDGNTPS